MKISREIVFCFYFVLLGAITIFGSISATAQQNCNVFDDTPQPIEYFNTNTLNCKVSEKAYQAASAIVFGRKLNVAELEKYLRHGAEQFGSSYSQKSSEGIKLTDAINFLKIALAKSKPETRADVIDRAFMEAYGRKADPNEQSANDSKVTSQKGWFASIINDEIYRMSKDSFLRTVMIKYAYANSLGRVATTAEITFWVPRLERYPQIVEGNRAWLYTGNGAQDLRDATIKALTIKYSKKPSENQIKNAIASFSSKRLIYPEMVKLANIQGYGY